MSNNNQEEIDLEELESNLTYTGTQINYYFVCKRKLWFFSHHMELENESDLVLLGKLLHEHSYLREMKEIEIERIKIDFIKKKGEVHEIKRSKKIERAHEYQLLYYLYFLKYYANKELRGVLNYPLLKKNVIIVLTKDKEEEMSKILSDIKAIIDLDKPPAAEWKMYCRSCAYRDLCWI